MRFKNSGKASETFLFTFNETASWLRELELTYCSDVESNQYVITRDTLKTAVKKYILENLRVET